MHFSMKRLKRNPSFVFIDGSKQHPTMKRLNAENTVRWCPAIRHKRLVCSPPMNRRTQCFFQRNEMPTQTFILNHEQKYCASCVQFFFLVRTYINAMGNSFTIFWKSLVLSKNAPFLNKLLLWYHMSVANRALNSPNVYGVQKSLTSFFTS